MSFATLKTNAEHRMFNGKMGFYQHPSEVCQADMRFSIYLPPQAENHHVPALYFLSGLTCTEENFMIKSGAQQFAAHYGIALIVPDPSPRKTGIADEDADWTYGSGAGYYLNATQEPWAMHYQMYNYVVDELPKVIAANFNVDTANASLFGHSMGGHGTLTIGLRNPGTYKSLSAFAPICNPIATPLGTIAYSRYLGEDKSAWEQYDTLSLLKQTESVPNILIDQGTEDSFFKDGNLHVRELEAYAQAKGLPFTIRYHQGYDHGYYFIATYMQDHIKHHAQYLLG